MSDRGQWYKTLGGPYDGPTGVVQPHRPHKGERLPEHVLRLADAEYQHQYGGQQDFERIQERGGFGLLEVVMLLADHLDRLGAEPSPPREGR